MEQAKGIVRAVDNNSAKVFIQRHSMCGDSCASCNLCGDKETVIEAVNEIQASQGDHVVVEIETERGLLAAFLAYGVPILLVIASVCAIPLFSLKESTAIFAMALLIVVWFGVMRLMERKGVLGRRFGARITRLCEEEPAEGPEDPMQ